MVRRKFIIDSAKFTAVSLVGASLLNNKLLASSSALDNQETRNNNIYSTNNTINEMTPQAWGGFNFIYSPFQKVYFSISCYYFSHHRLHLDSEKTLRLKLSQITMSELYEKKLY